MSIASEITRLQISKADIKAQVNIDVDDINEGTDFIDEETLDDYADLIEDMQEAYKQYIPINSTSDTQIEAPKGGAIMGKTIKGNTSQNGTPTPSSPVPVNNVTGLQTITISNGTNSRDYEVNLGNIELNKIGTYQDFIRKGTGKNLLQNNSTTQTINGVTFTKNDDGSILVNGTATRNTWYVLNSSITLEAGTYTISSGNTNNNIRLVCDALGGFIINGLVKKTINETKTSDVSINAPSGSTANNLLFKPMIVEGSTATTYEPYGYKDKWYVEKNINKVVLDSNTNINTNTNYISIGRFDIQNYTDGIKGSSSKAGAISNYYNSAFNTNNGSIFLSGIDNHINIMNTSYSNNLDGFKTWLGTNKPIVYYVLATPTYTLIENEELTEQLDRIMQLYEGQNNILVTGDLAATLDLDYIVKAENHL